MKGVVLVLLLSSLTICVFSTDLDNDMNFFAGILHIAITLVEVILSNPKYAEIDLINPVSLNTSSIPDIFKIEGTFDANRLFIYGLNGILSNSDLTTIEWSEELQALEIGVNISIPNEVGIKLDSYVMDLGLFDAIPLYGNGDIGFGMHSIHFDIFLRIYVAVTQTDENEKKIETKILDLDLNPELSAFKVEVTNFWNNPELSTVISDTLSELLDLLVVIYDLDKECTNCVLSSVLQTILNNDQSNIWKNLAAKCKHICIPPANAFLNSIFQDKDTQNFNITDMTDKDIIRIIEIAVDYMTKEIERHISSLN
ncbi:hypothetical protein ABEB36_008008 [Hypothenemus hampei]|uniref:Uncharacterized protein n=1 Tax=Hypothenemus hampei TaxID=57062 RepID=A0ABD1ENB5_HYPHA